MRANLGQILTFYKILLEGPKGFGNIILKSYMIVTKFEKFKLCCEDKNIFSI